VAPCATPTSAPACPSSSRSNGIGTDDDPLRADFIPRALSGLLNAIEDGVPVIGYIHWTLLDNFEWIFGFDKQLGIMSVDRTTFERTPKPSAKVYGQIARTNTIEL
jgi:beta-glucosidase